MNNTKQTLCFILCVVVALTLVEVTVEHYNGQYLNIPFFSVTPTPSTDLHRKSSSSSSSLSILYYQSGRKTQCVAGLDHNSNVLRRQLADALRYRFNHIIVGQFGFARKHNFFRKVAINTSAWHYWDLDAFGKAHGLVILESSSQQALQLLKSYENVTVVTKLSDGTTCRNVTPPFHGLTVRQCPADWWALPDCFNESSVVAALKPSAVAVQCAQQVSNGLKPDPQDEYCLIHGRIRRGDRLAEYKTNVASIIEPQNVTRLVLHLAKNFCNDEKKRFIFYLATNGNERYVTDVLNAFDNTNVTVVTQKYLLSQPNVNCSGEFESNNFWLYHVETIFASNTRLIDIGFVFNPKYDGQYKLNVGANTTRIQFNDIFS